MLVPFSQKNTFASLLVKTREGRPILLSSNHKNKYGGGINARCQASVLSLYDSNRLKGPLEDSVETSWSNIDKKLNKKLKDSNKKIVLVSSTIISPSAKQILKDFKKFYKTLIILHMIHYQKTQFFLQIKRFLTKDLFLPIDLIMLIVLFLFLLIF